MLRWAEQSLFWPAFCVQSFTAQLSNGLEECSCVNRWGSARRMNARARTCVRTRVKASYMRMLGAELSAAKT